MTRSPAPMAYSISVWVADIETILVGRAGISIAPFAAEMVTGNAGGATVVVVAASVDVVGGRVVVGVVVAAVVGGLVALGSLSAAEVLQPAAASMTAASSSNLLVNKTILRCRRMKAVAGRADDVCLHPRLVRHRNVRRPGLPRGDHSCGTAPDLHRTSLPSRPHLLMPLSP